MAKARAQNDHEYEPESKFCCHAVLIGLKKKTLTENVFLLVVNELVLLATPIGGQSGPL